MLFGNLLSIVRNRIKSKNKKNVKRKYRYFKVTNYDGDEDDRVGHIRSSMDLIDGNDDHQITYPSKHTRVLYVKEKVNGLLRHVFRFNSIRHYNGRGNGWYPGETQIEAEEVPETNFATSLLERIKEHNESSGKEDIKKEYRRFKRLKHLTDGLNDGIAKEYNEKMLIGSKNRIVQRASKEVTRLLGKLAYESETLEDFEERIGGYKGLSRLYDLRKEKFREEFQQYKQKQAARTNNKP